MSFEFNGFQYSEKKVEFIETLYKLLDLFDTFEFKMKGSLRDDDFFSSLALDGEEIAREVFGDWYEAVFSLTSSRCGVKFIEKMSEEIGEDCTDLVAQLTDFIYGDKWVDYVYCPVEVLRLLLEWYVYAHYLGFEKNSDSVKNTETYLNGGLFNENKICKAESLDGERIFNVHYDLVSSEVVFKRYMETLPVGVRKRRATKIRMTRVMTALGLSAEIQINYITTVPGFIEYD